jgi:mycofactocin system glycosyltransferase
VVAFVDSDVQLAPGCLRALAAHLGDGRVAAVAPRIVPRPAAAPGWLARYEEVRSPLDLGASSAEVRPGSRVPFVPTAVLLITRRALESVDGFDTSLRFGEDVDLVWRLCARGWHVRYEATVRANHPCRTNLRSWLGQRVSYGTSAAPLARRHGNAVAPLGISPWSALAWSAVILGRPLLGVGVGVCTTAALVPKLRGLDDPTREAVRIAGKGNLYAGQYVADALRRTWWPLAFVCGVCCRRSRPALVAALVLPPLLERKGRRFSGDAIGYAVLRLLDDVTYGAGVWRGCVRERSIRALLPAFSGHVSVGS